MTKEFERKTLPGGLILLLLLLVIVASIGGLANFASQQQHGAAIGFLVLGLVALFFTFGVFTVNPNEARVVQLFGAYRGTVKTPGLRWANPLFTKTRISQRVRNFDSDKLKVNDAGGNPIEIAAVVVWKVVDTAEASFDVDNYENFVRVQSEAALRKLASHYAYDAHDDSVPSLRGSSAEINEHLKQEVQERLDKAGVQVIEARISHLAYAQEIAQAMLQRQQAGAIVAARQLIVQGAVGMVESALEMLSRHKVVELDEAQKATMVSNLLVVLCGERGTQPVVNTGTLYS